MSDAADRVSARVVVLLGSWYKAGGADADVPLFSSFNSVLFYATKEVLTYVRSSAWEVCSLTCVVPMYEHFSHHNFTTPCLMIAKGVIAVCG